MWGGCEGPRNEDTLWAEVICSQVPAEDFQLIPSYPLLSLQRLLEGLVELHLKQTQEGGREGWLYFCLSMQTCAGAFIILYEGLHFKYGRVDRRIPQENGKEDRPIFHLFCHGVPTCDKDGILPSISVLVSAKKVSVPLMMTAPQ